MLKIAAGQANYGSVMLGDNTAHGIAVAAAEGRNNPSQHVAQVSLTSGGNIDVESLLSVRMWNAINPENVRAQIEGSLLWGLSSTFYEEIQCPRMQISTLIMAEMTDSELDIHIVENGFIQLG